MEFKTEYRETTATMGKTVVVEPKSKLQLLIELLISKGVIKQDEVDAL